MRGLNVHENITVSVTKLTLSLRVGFISSHLTADKLFPVNPRAIMGPPNMSLLLEAKSMLSLIIKPRLILVSHTDDLGWYITSTSRERCSFKTSTGLSESQMLRQGNSRIASQTVFQLTWCFRKTFLLTSLELPEPSKWLPTERRDPSYLSVLQQQPVLSQEHQSSGGRVNE